MIRTIIWFIYFSLYLVFILPKLAYAKYLEKRGNIKTRDEFVFRTAKSWARSLVKLSGAKVRVTGEENVPVTGSFVIIGNHQGNFDIPLLLGYINSPIGFIAKAETAKIPLISTWMKYLYCVFMDRNDIRQSISAINEGVAYLKEGHSLVIFPEGTRSRGDEVGEFKQGSFKLATKAGVPILPVTIKGSYKLFEEKHGKISPSKVEIVISPPIDTEGLDAQEMKNLPENVRNIIINNLN